MHRVTLSLLLLLFASGCARVGVAVINAPEYLRGGYTRTTAAYGPEAQQILDIYQPAPRPTQPTDVIVFLHGGRWTSGSKDQYRFLGAALARQGFVAVIPNYRKYPAVRFPVFAEDAARAIAWTFDHSADFGGNPARLHVVGHSAGAHLGALVAANPAYLAAFGKTPRQVIHSFAGLAGPYAFVPEEPDLIDMFGPPERFPQMQVPTFITGQEPPMLLQYGLADQAVGAFNHERLAAAIAAKGGEVRVITYPGLGHLGMIRAFSWLAPGAPVMVDMVGWLGER